ncbi:hypothetical protein [Streptodolium elevatio]|uniref:Transposase n=1 Tax=Streptodolium elevatio TaxID=3157996 RepID=A0ABV3DK91_9ACTN
MLGGVVVVGELEKLKMDLVEYGVRYQEARNAELEVLRQLKVAVVAAMAAGLTPGQAAEFAGIRAGTARRWRTEERADQGRTPPDSI